MKIKNLLFITWDGPQTSYMEGLFLPIFQEIAKKSDVKFHVLQFTWGDEKKNNQTKSAAEKMGIHYSALPIIRKPNASVGSLWTVFTSSNKIKKYIQENKIDIVMPRSTFPAMMVNALKKLDCKIIFDADGLPIEERVDFAGLKKDSLTYRWLKAAETQILNNANAIITRSQKAIDIHVATVGEQYRSKFSVVQNGRDLSVFNFKEELRTAMRKRLGIQDELLLVYAGSLGPQYCFPEMLEIFRKFSEKKAAKFLILTGNIDFAAEQIPEALQSHVILKKVASSEVPAYLNASDLAFALRQPSFSMQGVAPIKLGEYLLCGLPVIASKGIGDTDDLLKNFEECFLYDDSIGLPSQSDPISNFLEKSIFTDRKKVAEKAVAYFSLEAAAESYITALKKIF